MDCPSEETLIRMKLEGLSMIKSLVFDIETEAYVFHSEESSEIENHLKELNLGSQLKKQLLSKRMNSRTIHQYNLLKMKNWQVLQMRFNKIKNVIHNV